MKLEDTHCHCNWNFTRGLAVRQICADQELTVHSLGSTIQISQKMPLSQRSLQIATFLVIFFLACFATSQETENKRAVTEHQFMHDKGRALQGLKRLMWLHNAMGDVHTARARDAAHSNSLWDLQKSQDLPDFYDSISREETPNLVKQLLLRLAEREQAFPVLKKTDLLQYLKNAKGSWSLQDLSDLFQVKEDGSKRNPTGQTNNSSL